MMGLIETITMCCFGFAVVYGWLFMVVGLLFVVFVGFYWYVVLVVCLFGLGLWV